MSGSHKAWRPQLRSLALPLELAQRVEQLAQELRLPSHVVAQGNEKAWLTAVVFLAQQDLRLSEKQTNKVTRLTVTDLLNTTGCHIVSLFSMLGQLRHHQCLRRPELVQQVVALERRYCILSALYDKFHSVTEEVLSGAKAEVREQAWLIFLLATSTGLPDLLGSFHLLLCGLAWVLAWTPAFQLGPHFDEVASASQHNPLPILQSLVAHLNAELEEALQVYKTQWSRLTRELGTTGGRPLEIQDLRTRYQKLYQESSSLDETGFLTRQTFLVPPDSKREIDPSSSTGPHSILAEVLGSLEGPSRLNSGGDKPSASLRQLLERCSLKETILHTLVGSLQTQFVRAYVDAAGVAELAARRLARLGKRLYYAALETLLRAEEQHLSASDFNLLLQNEVFHSALLACCLEVVLFSCGTEMGPRLTTPQKRADSTRFPWILQAFKLQPYDFFKLLETFFKYLTASSEDLAQHLQELENQILQELAWSTTSPVFDLLRSSTTPGSSDGPPPPLLWSPGPKSPSIPRRSPALNLFLNKVSKLGHQRLELLAKILDVSDDLVPKIWNVAEQIIYQKTSLMRGRHLDQLVMCCIYSVCKLSDCDVSFKYIIQKYMTLGHAHSSIYKDVLVADNRRDTLIVFYNQIFTPVMKDYIMGQFSAATSHKENSKFHCNSPSTLSPAHCVAGRRNIYISPLRSSPSSLPGSPVCHTFSFPSIGRNTAHLQAINEAINNACIPKRPHPKPDSTVKKALKFDGTDYQSSRK